MAFRISRVVCILGRPVASGRGRWGSRQLHSASERSLWYAFLMLGILPSECLRTPFQTVSLRSSEKFAQPRSNAYGRPAIGPGLLQPIVASSPLAHPLASAGLF